MQRQQSAEDAAVPQPTHLHQGAWIASDRAQLQAVLGDPVLVLGVRAEVDVVAIGFQLQGMET
jgi:hypothetical protein